jgi:hypothetical protein
VPEALSGEATLEFSPDGVRWSVTAPVAVVLMPLDGDSLNLSGIFVSGFPSAPSLK